MANDLTMPREKAASTLYDNQSVYGWISILLHWTTAVIIIALWFIGKNILSAPPEEVDARRALHVSIAGTAWLIILFRIFWRFRSGHPRLKGQSPLIHKVGKVTHYAMIVVAAFMLLSGPLLVWADGYAVTLFGTVSIPGPFGESRALREFAWLVHESMANVLFLLVLLHIGGALKHLMFHHDETIIRMIWPGRPDEKDFER